jgi:hypothetical protein
MWVEAVSGRKTGKRLLIIGKLGGGAGGAVMEEGQWVGLHCRLSPSYEWLRIRGSGGQVAQCRRHGSPRMVTPSRS